MKDNSKIYLYIARIIAAVGILYMIYIYYNGIEIKWYIDVLIFLGYFSMFIYDFKNKEDLTGWFIYFFLVIIYLYQCFKYSL